MKFKSLFLLFHFLLLFIAPTGFAADLEKEERIKEQIIDYILEGDPVSLQSINHKFLAIFNQADDEQAKGAVIIMHGRGHHPNWPEVVQPLRNGLVEFGWHTLSIQMPVLDNESTFYDYLHIIPEAFPRIEAAISFLNDKGISNIVLIAHSCSVHMSIPWLVEHPDKGVIAFIGIGMGSTDKGQPMLQPFPLEKAVISSVFTGTRCKTFF